MPLAIDLFCGLGGWTSGLLAEGYDVVGFDIEAHLYGEHRYPAQLVVQDVLTLHGSQFREAALIVASPPCQAYSWMAMPWSRAKAKAAAIRADASGLALAELNALFDACFRIQREASAAAGRHIPMVVENVRGAQPWVGRARWNYGSFFLWGDVPALMPNTNRWKNPGVNFNEFGKTGKPSSADWTRQFGVKVGGLDWKPPGDPRHRKGQAFNPAAQGQAVREGRNPDGRKNGNDWFGAGEDCSLQRRAGSKSPARKFASAMIAKIPEPLSRHIAATFYPREAGKSGRT